MVRTDYQFNAAAQTVTFSGPVILNKIGIISNITDGIIIYNSMDANKTGTLAGKTLTLKYSTAAMSNEDILQVFYSSDECGPDDDTQIEANEILSEILVELRVITELLNEGLNTKEDICKLRTDECSDL